MTTEDPDNSPAPEQSYTRRGYVEPVIAIFTAVYNATSTVLTQYVYSTVSGQNNLTTVLTAAAANTDVDNSTTNWMDYANALETDVQNQSAHLSTVLDICLLVPSMVLSIVYGAYSDHVGRKLPMLCPLIGQLVKLFLYLFVVKYSLPIYWMMIANMIEGLFGGQPALMMSCYGSLVDICHTNKRTIRLAIMDACIYFCGSLGQILTGIALFYVGYFWSFFILAVVQLLNLAYIVVCIPEQKRGRRKDGGAVFGVQQITQGLQLYIANDDYAKMWQRWLLLVATLCCDSLIWGRWDVLTLFALNSPLNWTSVLIGAYRAWTVVIAGVGILVLVRTLHNRLRDIGLAILGCISGIVYFLLLSFSPSTLAMFLVAVVGLGSMLPVTILRVMNSKITPKEHQGALFAILSVLTVLADSFASVVYNTTYGATLLIMKGFVFIVMACVQCLGLLIFIIYFVKSDKQPEDVVIKTEQTPLRYETFENTT